MSSTDDIRTNSGGQPMLARHREGQGAPETRPKQNYFPLGYKDGWSQWWAGLAPAATEHKVLTFVPYLQQPPTHTQTGSAPASAAVSSMAVDQSTNKEAAPVRTSSLNDPYGPRQWHSKLVQLAGKNRFLNEFSVERLGEDTEHNLVMLHGYGAGLGFFYKNFEGLSRVPNWKLYALDLLGMGRSSRPPFKIHAKEKEDRVREAENWFVDALEEWRIKRGIDKMTLLGHSLGGYMAVCYALKYPGHLNKLILASPVGIPEDPYAMNAALPDPKDATMAAEFTESQDDSHPSSVGDNNNFLNARSKAEAATPTPPSAPNGMIQDPKAPRKPLPKWLTTLWDANISPFSLVRLSGPLGPRLVSGWTSRRFSHLPNDEALALHDYAYSLFRQRGSGEYALAYILAPGAFARSPLLRRIQGVGRQVLGVDHTAPVPDTNTSKITPPTTSETPSPDASSAVSKVRKETGIPVVIMYGEQDWMDVGGGHAAAAKLRAAQKEALSKATAEEKAAEKGDVEVKIIKKAGHHLYLDGWEEFNKFIAGEMKDVSEGKGYKEES